MGVTLQSQRVSGAGERSPASSSSPPLAHARASLADVVQLATEHGGVVKRLGDVAACACHLHKQHAGHLGARGCCMRACMLAVICYSVQLCSCEAQKMA